MIKYNDFLLERMWKGSRKLTKGQFLKLYKENCKNFDPNIMIFKNFYKMAMGEKDDNIGNFVFINNKKRESSMKGNQYTLMINNFESWKNYPKRNQICSLNDSWGDVGKSHIVIPYDNSKWGVCDTSDIWWSKFLQGQVSSIRHLFIRDLKRFNVRDDSWEHFVGDIKKLPPKGIQYYSDRINEFIIKSRRNIKDIMKFFIKEFTPEKIGVELHDFKELDNIKDVREIWTDYPCLYVDRDIYYNEILPEIRKINIENV